MVTCYVRYVINPDKIPEFEQYARLWISLIEKLGGRHHGYFLAEATPDPAPISFPGVGEEGPRNVAVALYSFPSIELYEGYREMARQEPDCQKARAIWEESHCFTSYERNFVRRIS